MGSVNWVALNLRQRTGVALVPFLYDSDVKQPAPHPWIPAFAGMTINVNTA